LRERREWREKREGAQMFKSLRVEAYVMPAHNSELRDKNFEAHVLFVEKGMFVRVPDGHADITFRWHGGTRTWDIEGVMEPETWYLDKTGKHNWNPFETGLPKSQGDVLVRFVQWVQSLSAHA
jgi:hypothetical protein